MAEKRKAIWNDSTAHLEGPLVTMKIRKMAMPHLRDKFYGDMVSRHRCRRKSNDENLSKQDHIIDHK